MSDSALNAARRTQCQIVNFGVVAVARVTGEVADRLLDLRCECGAPLCRERIQVTCSEYEAVTKTGLPIVSSLHARGEPGADDRAQGPGTTRGQEAEGVRS